MKFLALVVALVASVAATFAQSEESICMVQKDCGIYIFTDCEPTQEYENLGLVKSRMSWTGQYSEIKSKLARKAVEDYPNADAIVVSLTKGSTDKAMAIKFKTSSPNNAQARAYKENGVFIFTDAEPNCKYTVVGRVSSSFAWNSEYATIKTKLLRKALKDYPQANGVILSLTTGGSDKAVVITFDK